MKIIGLTGGIASGKSTVSRLLAEHGYAVIDADRIAWQLAEPDNFLWQAYYDRYGEKVLNDDRTLNRQAVASVVFQNPAEKQWMDSAAHPMIKAEIQRNLARLIAAGRDVVFLDVPLLYEAGWDYMADIVWVVYADEANQLRRLCQRNGFSEAEAQRRIGAQMPMSEKKRRADVVIDNNGSLEDLSRQVHKLFAALCA